MEPLGKLFTDAARFHSGRIHSAVSKLGVGRVMPHVLGYICHNDGCLQSEVNKVCHVSPATTTVMLQSMEKNGLIVRRTDETDQRCMRIYITDAGRKIEKLGKEAVDSGDKAFFAVLSDEERMQLRAILTKLNAPYEKEMKEF